MCKPGRRTHEIFRTVGRLVAGQADRARALLNECMHIHVYIYIYIHPCTMYMYYMYYVYIYIYIHLYMYSVYIYTYLCINDIPI